MLWNYNLRTALFTLDEAYEFEIQHCPGAESRQPGQLRVGDPWGADAGDDLSYADALQLASSGGLVDDSIVAAFRRELQRAESAGPLDHLIQVRINTAVTLMRRRSLRLPDADPARFRECETLLLSVLELVPGHVGAEENLRALRNSWRDRADEGYGADVAARPGTSTPQDPPPIPPPLPWLSYEKVVQTLEAGELDAVALFVLRREHAAALQAGSVQGLVSVKLRLAGALDQWARYRSSELAAATGGQPEDNQQWALLRESDRLVMEAIALAPADARVLSGAERMRRKGPYLPRWEAVRVCSGFTVIL